MSSHQLDFVLYEIVTDMTINVANGKHVPVSGRGTICLLLGEKVVEERDWLHIPALPMRLKSVRLHRCMHPDNAFVATHDECTLMYPLFALSIDDTHDCVTPCDPAPPGREPDFDDSPFILSSPGFSNYSYGHAFQSPHIKGRKYAPFPQSQAALEALNPADRALHDRPSSRDVPAQYVPDFPAPAVQRFTNEELHKLFGNPLLT
jgi:hypothetical protein